MKTVWCLFLNESDGYTYSCQTLIAVYLSQNDAETGLLELIQRAEQLRDENNVFETKMKICHQKQDYTDFQKIVEEQKLWRFTLTGDQYFVLPEADIEKYQIQQFEIGKTDWN